MDRRLVALLAVPATLAAAAPAPAAPAVPGGVAVVRTANLNLRATPGDGRVLTRLRTGTTLTVTCQRNGPLASGRGGASRIWNRVVTASGRAGWVADGHVASSDQALVAPYCGAPLPTTNVPGATEGACGIVAPVALIPPFARVEDLIAAAVPGARASQAATGVPASVTLAQAILETGGGRVAALANNYFGLKAQAVAAPARYAWGTNAVGCVLKKTWEVRGGRAGREVAAFRAYATLDASIADHGERLRTNPVYAPAFAHTDDAKRFAREVARRYATDPAYAGKLLVLMDRHDLEQHDR